MPLPANNIGKLTLKCIPILTHHCNPKARDQRQIMFAVNLHVDSFMLVYILQLQKPGELCDHQTQFYEILLLLGKYKGSAIVWIILNTGVPMKGNRW